MAKSRIRIQFKGNLQPVVTEPIDTDEAQRLLEATVCPNIGKPVAIRLPGEVVNGKDVASGQLVDVEVRRRRPQRTGAR